MLVSKQCLTSEGIQGRAVTDCRGASCLCKCTLPSKQTDSRDCQMYFSSITALRLPHSHIWYWWKQHLTHPVLHYVHTSEGQDALLPSPSLTDTVDMSNDSCRGSEGASKWTKWQCEDTSKSTDNTIILKTLYRMMRSGESIWLTRSKRHMVPHALLGRWCWDCWGLGTCRYGIVRVCETFSVMLHKRVNWSCTGSWTSPVYDHLGKRRWQFDFWAVLSFSIWTFPPCDYLISSPVSFYLPYPESSNHHPSWVFKSMWSLVLC